MKLSNVSKTSDGMKKQYLLEFIVVVLLTLFIVSPVLAHDGVEHTSATEVVAHQVTPRGGFLQFFKNLFSKKPDEAPTTNIVASASALTEESKAVEQKKVDQEIVQLEAQLTSAAVSGRVQDAILTNPVLSKMIPTTIVSDLTSWKTIEEFDRLLAKIAEKSPAKALELIERGKVVGEKQLIKTPVTKISKKNITITISHFDYDKKDQADYFGTYVDGRVVRTVFSEQFRGLGGEYKIAELSGYQFGNNILITQMSGFSQVVQLDTTIHTRSTSDADYKVLVLLVDYLDSDPAQQLTNAQIAQDVLFNGDLHDFFYEQSYGKMNMVGDVYGWYTLQSNAQGTDCNPLVTTSNGSSTYLNNQELLNFMINDSIQLNDYDHFLIIANCKNVTGGGFAGILSPNTSGLINEELISLTNTLHIPTAIVKTSTGSANLHAMAHEIGHMLYGAPDFLGTGIPHAKAKDCGVVVYASSGCLDIEYGNYYDAMGSWQAFSNHFRVGLKEYLGWIEPEQILTITESSGEEDFYAIVPTERQNANHNGGYKMAKLWPVWSSKPLYLLEYRQGIGFDSSLLGSPLSNNTDGIFVYKIGTTIGSEGNRNARAVLLDMAPQDISWEEDIKHVALNVGRTYFDNQNGIFIETINANPQNAFFQVRYAECERRAPELIWSGDFNNSAPQAGELYRYQPNITYMNNDNAPCGASAFIKEATADSPITTIVSHSEFFISPGSGNNASTFTIVVPIGTLPGTYNVYVTITNQNSGQNATQIVPVVVE